jgi:hypothetical protein
VYSRSECWLTLLIQVYYSSVTYGTPEPSHWVLQEEWNMRSEGADEQHKRIGTRLC